jgi:glycerophosphoryl diester phosphodiesterase
MKAEIDMSPLVIAHRGASVAEPENTLRAFDLALRQGAQMIELDLQMTRDGHVIVLHDDTLARTTNMRGVVAEMNLDEVRQADAGKGERVPTLKETLELVRGRARLYLEIKDARAGAETLRIVRSLNCLDEVLLASFDTLLMQRLGDEVHDVELGVIVGLPSLNADLLRWRETFPWLALRAINFQVLSVQYELCFGFVVEKMKGKGKTLYVWTVDDERGFESMLARGVDGIVTNMPDKLISYLNCHHSLS